MTQDTTSTTVRRCDWCGAEIDPIDWCIECKEGRCTVHSRTRKRADARFCNDECRRADQMHLKQCLEPRPIST